MLIISRRAGESATIGNNITVTLVEVRAGQVRLSIDAPKEVSIMRDDARIQPYTSFRDSYFIYFSG
jgi:carbon storage regulator